MDNYLYFTKALCSDIEKRYWVMYIICLKFKLKEDEENGTRMVEYY